MIPRTGPTLEELIVLLENAANRTFFDYFECQQVATNVMPKAALDQTAPLFLIYVDVEPPEVTFSFQLLYHAVEAASSFANTNFILAYCRIDSGRVRLYCSSAAAFADFDEPLYAHLSSEEYRFIRDHVIDLASLSLEKSCTKAAVLGSAGSTIAEELTLEVIPKFKFKDDVGKFSGNSGEVIFGVAAVSDSTQHIVTYSSRFGEKPQLS